MRFLSDPELPLLLCFTGRRSDVGFPLPPLPLGYINADAEGPGRRGSRAGLVLFGGEELIRRAGWLLKGSAGSSSDPVRFEPLHNIKAKINQS